MQRKPYLLFFLLLTVLSFILGFRAGQKTEKTNEVVDYVLSITPAPKLVSPTPAKLKEYKSKRWGIDFKFPSNLSINESTNTPEIIFEPIDPNATGAGSKK